MLEKNLPIYFEVANALKDLEESNTEQMKKQILSKVSSHYDIWLDVFKFNYEMIKLIQEKITSEYVNE